jgi:hypothetical protein
MQHKTGPGHGSDAAAKTLPSTSALQCFDPIPE